VLGYDVFLPVLAALIHAAGFILYNIHTHRGVSHPNFTSWSVWALMACLNALTFSAATSWVIGLQTAVGAAGCVGTFVHALVTGRFQRPSTREILVLLVCIGTIVVWMNFSALAANLFLLMGVILSFEPTLRGVIRDPKNESRLLPWFLWAFAYCITTMNTYLLSGGFTAKLTMPIVLIVSHGIVPVICLTGKTRIRPLPKRP